MKLKHFRTPAVFLAICLSAFRLTACGDFFPNNLLNGGDEAVLAAPVADFQKELERMHLATNSFRAIITTNSFAKDSADAELMDLRLELTQMRSPASMAETIIKGHQNERGKLRAFEDSIEDNDRVIWDGTKYAHVPIYLPISPPTAQTFPVPPPGPSQDANPPAPPEISPPPKMPLSPPFPAVRITPGLPEEFAEYFAGAIAWENPAMSNSDVACRSWERVLTLPPSQRHFKSTWAAYMLGKYWMDKDPQKAIGYFQQTRRFAATGFADSCGLAAASFGLEALADLQRTNFEGAILLYIKQWQTGDGSALASLEETASRALATNDAVMLKNLAANPVTQRVITAYLISDQPFLSKEGQAARWLDAVEAAGVRDVDSAEELALAAYQAGEWDGARRWAERAPVSPVSQWLEAKLLLRAGNIIQAGAILAKVVERMESKDGNASNRLKDDLTMRMYSDYSQGIINASNEVLGELGVFHLSQRDYVESLDALLRSGFWMDAAYVAERILNVDELKAYVDQNWPEMSSTNRDQAGLADGTDVRNDIRYLLARRLGRLGRSEQARAYYPKEVRPLFDSLMRALRNGHNKGLPQNERADALVSAAMMTRTNGMKLLGTELAPDWFLYDGDFEDGVSAQSRTNEETRLYVPSADELQRYTRHDVEPEERYHYRFLAADLAVEAAGFMPDNSDDTARLLCTAGSWIKYRDPQKADPIYKELVTRCRYTQIGRQADLMRWFPVLDDSGHPMPYTSRAARAEETWQIFQDTLGNSTDPGYFYYTGTIHMMDRKNGWAQNVTTLLLTNKNWVFEQNAILRTTNGGTSWKAVLCASPRHSLTLFAYDKDTAWVTSDYDESGNVFVLRTIDGGRSWGCTELAGSDPVQDCELSFPTVNQGWILLMPDHGMNSMPGYLYTSAEYGLDWGTVNSTASVENNWTDPDGAQPGFADVHPYLPCGGAIKFQNSTNGWLLGQLTATTRAFLFFTHDGGANWQEQKFNAPSTLRDGSIEPCALPQFFGNDGIVETSFVPNDPESTNFYRICYDTHDGGRTWEATSPIKFIGVSSFISSETGWTWSPEPHNSNSTAPVKGVLYRTNDGGRTWKPIKVKQSLEAYLEHGENIVQLDFVDDAYGWAIAQDSRNKTKILKSTDGGETWAAINE